VKHRFMAATERALARVANGEIPYRAAKAEGIALNTMYCALKRLKLSLVNDRNRECVKAMPGIMRLDKPRKR
jgi:hypothetical protein